MVVTGALGVEGALAFPLFLISQSKIDCKIVHEIPGRIRFRVPLIAEDAEYTRKLQVLLEADAKVTDVRINPTVSPSVSTL